VIARETRDRSFRLLVRRATVGGFNRVRDAGQSPAKFWLRCHVDQSGAGAGLAVKREVRISRTE
jgi:hypothetical protein